MFQICDLEDDEIQSIVEEPSNVAELCLRSTGWFTENAWKRILDVLNIRFRNVMESELSKETQPDIVDAHLAETETSEAAFASFLGELSDEPLSPVHSSSSEDSSCESD